METKLARIAQVAKERPTERFTSLFHLINERMLMECHQEMAARKAPGTDGVTKDEYGEQLEANVQDLWNG